MEPKIVHEKITQEQLIHMTREGYYENMAKLAVDVEREILAIGGEWHSDAEEVLIADGSKATDVWGVNFYPWKASNERIVYTSLINLKPVVQHRKMEVTDRATRSKIHDIITQLLLDDKETLPAE